MDNGGESNFKEAYIEENVEKNLAVFSARNQLKDERFKCLSKKRICSDPIIFQC